MQASVPLDLVFSIFRYRFLYAKFLTRFIDKNTRKNVSLTKYCEVNRACKVCSYEQDKASAALLQGAY